MGGAMLALHMGACIVKCQSVSKDCLADCMVELAHYSPPCAECFGEMPGCIVEQCLGSCMNLKNDPLSCAMCLKDTVPQCTDSFMSCTGFASDGDDSVVKKEDVRKEMKVMSKVMEKHFELQ